MSCNTGLPKIFTKKNTGIIDIIVFIIKYCLLFDTSSLFVNEKMPLNKEIKRNKSGGGSNGFDLMEFFLLDIGNTSMIGGADFGGRGDQAGIIKLVDDKTKEKDDKEDQEAQDEITRERDREREFRKRDEKKDRIREEIEDDITSQIDEGVSMDTGLKGDDELRKDIMSLIKDGFREGTEIVSKKVKGILMLLVYGSVYPAVPFFAVMALMFGSLKYLFYKIRIF